MLDSCGEKNVARVEMIPIQTVDEAFERLEAVALQLVPFAGAEAPAMRGMPHG